MATVAGRPVDERIRKVGLLRKLLNRPELGAVAGAVLVFAFFAVVAGDRGFLSKGGTIGYLEVSAQLGIIAIPVALLMIAGEFDLSVGSMIGAAGILIAIPIAEFGWPLWAALLLAFGVALLVGFTNGFLVIRTGLPSFIVTLGTLFILRGATIGFTRLITGRTQVSGLKGETEGSFLVSIFAGGIAGIPASIFWWVGLAALATWILMRTAFGNWIFGTGGNPVAARNVGVPVQKVKVTLFVIVSSAAALVGIMIALRLGSVQAGQGIGEEFTYIIAAVVGGCLLTGGYGSAIGASLGALIVGMAFIGIQFSGWNTDWRFLFLGVILLMAVLVNNLVRKSAEGARR